MTLPFTLPADPMAPAFQPEPEPEAPVENPPPTLESSDGRDLLADGLDPRDPKVRAAMLAMFGPGFPMLTDIWKREDWAHWAQTRWQDLSPTVQKRIHAVHRNRLFRQGYQWVSSVNGGPWREPPKPQNAARVVYNMIAPALDQRVEIITEQRPGFSTRPATQDPDDVRKAEAQQFALEYQFDQQDMQAVYREIAYWVGTDGVCFQEVFWDDTRGPWNEEQQEVPGASALRASGLRTVKAPLGDVNSRVCRMEKVRVSPNATAAVPPFYVIIRDRIPKQQAVVEHGYDVAKQLDDAQRDEVDGTGGVDVTRLGLLESDPDERLTDQPTVERFIVYGERCEVFPHGFTMVAIGGEVQLLGPLLFSCVPVVRWTDGSTDPAYFCKAEMEKWLDSQMRVNAVLSKWVENVRLHAGPRLLAKEHAIKGETLLGGSMSLISVAGLGPLSEVVQPIQGFSLSQDALQLLQLEKKAFEDLSGWNDTSRGSFSSDQSGRAILAIREQLERVFAPLVGAAARSMSHWARITLKAMKFGYDEPRMLGVLGRGRPDLMRAIGADDLDGAVDVWVDPETLMPMPKSLRLFLLKDLVQMQAMTPQEYRRRLPFGYTRQLTTPDEDQESRARRVVEALRRGEFPEILWVDDEAIHQDVLQRELILPGDTPEPLRKLALERWMLLAQQASAKQMAMMGMGMPPMAGSQPQPGGEPLGGPGSGASLSPEEQPFQGTSPSIAAGTASMMGAGPDSERLAKASDPALGA